MNAKIYDLIIIGGGPVGINCAIEAQKSNLEYLLLEKGTLVNSLYNFPRNMTFFSTSVNLEIADVPFISHLDKPTRSEALEYYRRLMFHFGLNIHTYECVEKVTRHKDLFEVKSNKACYQSRNIVVATGFYDNPNMLNVQGEELDKVKHYYDEVHRYIGKKVVIVGGANSACDVALECWQKGADVTMVVRNSELYENVKYWILPNIRNRIKEGSIQAYFNSKITNITESKVFIENEGKTIEIENDFVLAMTGYHPNYSFLQSLGIIISNEDNQPVYNNKTLESTVEGIYLAGVILGGDLTSKLFIENTRSHGELIVSRIREKNNFGI